MLKKGVESTQRYLKCLRWLEPGYDFELEHWPLVSRIKVCLGFKTFIWNSNSIWFELNNLSGI